MKKKLLAGLTAGLTLFGLSGVAGATIITNINTYKITLVDNVIASEIGLSVNDTFTFSYWYDDTITQRNSYNDGTDGLARTQDDYISGIFTLGTSYTDLGQIENWSVSNNLKSFFNNYTLDTSDAINFNDNNTAHFKKQVGSDATHGYLIWDQFHVQWNYGGTAQRMRLSYYYDENPSILSRIIYADLIDQMTISGVADSQNIWGADGGGGAASGGYWGTKSVAFSTPGEGGAGSEVPEPATMLLFGTGIASLAAIRRRITKNNPDT